MEPMSINGACYLKYLKKCLNENFGASLRLYFIQNPIYGNGNTSAHCMLVCPADASYKQLGPRSNSAKWRAWSGSKLFDNLVIQNTENDREKCPNVIVDDWFEMIQRMLIY